MKTFVPFALHKREHRFYSALAAWLASLIALTLLPIPSTLARGLTGMLITGGGATCLVWLGRETELGDLRPPSHIRTAAFTMLAAAATVLCALARAHGVGGPEVAVEWPFAIGLAATITALAPVVGLHEVPASVAAILGGLAALAVGWLIGERAGVVLLCEFAAPGAMVGAAFASLIQRARNLTAAPSPE